MKIISEGFVLRRKTELGGRIESNDFIIQRIESNDFIIQACSFEPSPSTSTHGVTFLSKFSLSALNERWAWAHLRFGRESVVSPRRSQGKMLRLLSSLLNFLSVMLLCNEVVRYPGSRFGIGSRNS